MEFREGTLIKGKDLKGQVLCKVLEENMIMRGFQYHLGENVDVNPFATEGSCESGLYFCFLRDVMKYISRGTKLAILEIPDEENVYVDEYKYRTHRLIIKEVLYLGEVATWKYLHENGVDITANESFAVQIASIYGYFDVVKYLYENGADITVFNNESIVCASENGHLDIVRYLHENGADITAQNNYAVKLASSNGHLDIVKYLVENGVDIISDESNVVSCAADFGHQDVVDYLLANGAHL